MAVYAVYDTNGYRPILIARVKAQVEPMRYSNTEIVRYDHLTMKQVSILPYASAKACEAIMGENNAN